LVYIEIDLTMCINERQAIMRLSLCQGGNSQDTEYSKYPPQYLARSNAKKV